MSDEEIKLVEWGAFTEAVRQLQREFSELRAHLGKRCTDCALTGVLEQLTKLVDDHEKRLRWLEGKMLAIGGAGAAIVLLINKILK